MLDVLLSVEDQFRQNFTRSEKLLKDKQEQLETLTYETQIIKENSARLVREYSDELQYMNFHALWLDFDNNSHKFKNDIENNEVRLRMIEDWFFDKDTKRELVEIVCFGHDETAYEFKYQVRDKIFVISIPVFKNANSKNYYSFYYEIQNQNTEHSYTTVARTHFLDEMKELVKKYLSE